ncbi:MAG: aminotransferase [Acidobacteria bacterium]|nr:MAG: aminotransferase [Acidobacteriota bacterium]REK03356.1 MAG: aminotransferase [Acidobacteriota bacterium]
MDWKAGFSRFRDADPDQLHFAAHSHHYWPDVTFEAQQRVWLDAARHVDRKWDAAVFGDVLPRLQQSIARALSLSDPRSLCFAPNTHELLVRLVSAFERPAGEPLRILSSDGEFHSFERQTRRWEEAGQVTVERVPLEPFATFPKRFLERARAFGGELCYLSHVFFGSGYVFPALSELAEALPAETMMVVDGYHSWMALPVDWSGLEQRAFYLSGGYKYAMAGEGCCFAHCPPGYAERPVNTGWYAAFGDLAKPRGGGHEVPYARDGMRLFGATFDPSGLYRQLAVLDWLHDLGATVEDVHRHVVVLQQQLLDAVEQERAGSLRLDQLVPDRSLSERGHFLTFQRADAAALHRGLAERGVVTDVRGERIRFGFGVYQDGGDVEALVERLGGL